MIGKWGEFGLFENIETSGEMVGMLEQAMSIGR